MTTLRLVLLALVILLSACGPSAVQIQLPVELNPAPTSTPACNPNSVSDFLSMSDKTVRKFDDENTLANDTPRMQLAAEIGELQEIHQEYDGLSAPDCAQTYQHLVSEGMGWVIRGYIDFLADKGWTYTDPDFASAKQKFSDAVSELVNVHLTASGLPTPTPTLVWPQP